jgi:plastocyanin
MIRRTIATSVAVLTLGLGGARIAVADDQQKPQAVQDATVQFGAPQPQTPPVNIVTPVEVTILKGGTVTWIVNGGGHGIGIYKVSNHTTRDDIAQDLCLDPAVCNAAAANQQYIVTDGNGNIVLDSGTNPPMTRLNDVDRVLLGADGPVFLTGTTATNPNGNVVQYRFTKTGRYLVICMNRAHAILNGMFGFVTVVGDDDDN